MPIVDLELVRGLYKTPGAARLELDVAPRFKPGDRIVARNINPPGHTRLPATFAAKRASSSEIAAFSTFPIRVSAARETSRSISIPCASAPASYGVTRPRPRTAS